MIRLLFILGILALFGAAGYANQEQMISLHFFDWIETRPIKLYLIATTTFFIGFVIAALLFIPSWMKALLGKRKMNKRVEQLEIDLDRVRSATLRTENADRLPSKKDE